MEVWNIAAVVVFLLTWVVLEPLMAIGWPRKNDSLSVDIVQVRAAWMRKVLTRDNNFITCRGETKAAMVSQRRSHPVLTP